MKTKIVVLPIICLITFLVSSHLMNRAKSVQAQQPPTGQAVSSTTTIDEEVTPLDPSFIASQSNLVFVSQSNPATFGGSQFPAQAQGNYIDRDFDHNLFWTIIVQSYDNLNPTGTPSVVFSQTYDPFFVAKGTSTPLAFSQVVPLNPGNYVAQIRLQTTTTVYDPASDTTTTGTETIVSDTLQLNVTP